MLTHDETRLARIERKLDAIYGALVAMELYRMNTDEELLAEMERQTTVAQGIVVLIDQLTAKVSEAGGDQSKIKAALAGFKANSEKLAEKLVAHTPNENPGGSTGGASPSE